MNTVFTKTAIATVLATISLVSEGANNGIGGYWVDNIVPNAQAVQGTLMQSVTGANYSCGPTSLLFVSNHYMRKSTGKNSPNMSSVDASRKTLADIYAYMGISYNTPNGTGLDNLKSVARGKLGWTNVARMNGDGTVSVSKNMDNLIDYLNRDIPVLAVIRAGYTNNPVGKFDHIVILYAYNRQKDESGRVPLDPLNTRNLDTIDWYEPYYGKQGRVLRKEVTASGTTSAFNMAYFSFLAVGR